MKLGLQGITVVMASGDDEVGSYPGDDSHKNRCAGEQGDMEGRVLHPSRSVKSDASSMSVSIASYFSQVGPQLDFTSYAIPKLIATNFTINNDSNLNLGSGVYNQAGRGYPDVSAVDDHYLVRIAGDWHEIGSTSLAAPVWGAVLTLVAR
ncbi:hypothetical protein NEUTE1DRAFT_130900 [Neurospora tetrasperma FGSC 2508]|uniref:Peptidase S8/S53 domain-containing protein n=1 Tax=Neurospora tetrasperma (strain FGSC 2508 / ATCC MYA-4615 / P0657) TaxID=510951 RepID=F8MRY1_NEUT8|nr:uncharacterized protein NEUTE1DRAFT_130900 [Neurospora tetrasperma FGSC 2508]EGO54975.1 hypothetical protein NEUTE1DRAFT_130900 [Neurospora tetrasperma FGSC 2508]